MQNGDQQMPFANTATHLIACHTHNHKTTFGIFLAKGNYLELIAFGRVFRVWATSEYR